ncbi:MAG TPA: hypothetical protein VF657_05665 [Actinoplanes sp.]|jgi:hypothetical protein
MRNLDDRAAEGPQPDDGTGAVYTSTTARRTSRRKQAVAGGVGLAALLGAGAFLVTQQRADDSRTTLTNVGAPTLALSVDPATSPSESTAASTAATSPSAAASASPRSATPRPAASPSLPPEVAKRIAAARRAAEKDGVPVLRPVPQATADVAEVKVANTGSLKEDKQTMRLVSGRGDLSGQKELAWVADDGQVVGSSRCSQTFKLANNTKPERKPNLLICWRTSATKSVYTVAVDLDGDPSEQKSVAAIDAEWKRLG